LPHKNSDDVAPGNPCKSTQQKAKKRKAEREKQKAKSKANQRQQGV